MAENMRESNGNNKTTGAIVLVMKQKSGNYMFVLHGKLSTVTIMSCAVENKKQLKKE